MSRLQQVEQVQITLFQHELEFLGHVVSRDVIKPTNSKIKAIQEALAPTNKQQLQSFLGLMKYNAKFLPNLAYTLHPLYQVLHKNTKWPWKTKQKDI